MYKNSVKAAENCTLSVIGHVLSINLKVITAMVGDAGLTEDSIKNMERDEALIISCRAYLFLLFFDGKRII